MTDLFWKYFKIFFNLKHFKWEHNINNTMNLTKNYHDISDLENVCPILCWLRLSYWFLCEWYMFCEFLVVMIYWGFYYKKEINPYTFKKKFLKNFLVCLENTQISIMLVVLVTYWIKMLHIQHCFSDFRWFSLKLKTNIKWHKYTCTHT